MNDQQSKEPEEEIGFVRGIWSKVKPYLKELIVAAILWFAVLSILKLGGVVVSYLELPNQKKTALESVDFVGALITTILFVAFSLYTLGKIFVKENPELKAISKVTQFVRPSTQPATQSSFSGKDVLHRISEVLVLISIFVTVGFAVNDNYLFSFAIPATGTIKGLLVISDLPSDIRVFASFCLLLLITGGTIVATHAFSRKEFISAWLITASGSLGAGIGMLAGIGHIQMKRRKRTTNGKH